MDATKLTGLWKSKDKNGNTFLSGPLNAIAQLMVMPNTFKKEGDSKAPDYYVYVAPKKKEESKTDFAPNLDLNGL